MTFHDENILCAVVGSGNNRPLIFSGNDFLNILANASNNHANETIKVSPLLFKQLYTNSQIEIGLWYL